VRPHRKNVPLLQISLRQCKNKLISQNRNYFSCHNFSVQRCKHHNLHSLLSCLQLKICTMVLPYPSGEWQKALLCHTIYLSHNQIQIYLRIFTKQWRKSFYILSCTWKCTCNKYETSLMSIHAAQD
jgi:hypothetical protein